MDALTQLRHLARGNVHGGYRWMAVMADGGLICERCVRKEYKLIYGATAYPESARRNSQWECVGITNSGESETNEWCAHCNALYFEADASADNGDEPNEPDDGARIWENSRGGLILTLTTAEFNAGSHSGACDDDIAALLAMPHIASQMCNWNAAEVAAELKEYGAWDAAELADHGANLARLLWCACSDLAEGRG